MRIKLTRSGGLVGKKMMAELDTDLSEKDWKELTNAMEKRPTAADKKKRDSFYYSLQKDDEEQTRVAISIATIPPKFEELVRQLLDYLRPEK